MQIVGLAALDYLQNVAGQQRRAAARRKHDAGEVDYVSRTKATDRSRRDRTAIDLQLATAACKYNIAANNSARTQHHAPAADRHPAYRATRGNDFRSATVDEHV